jgi:hypothetical protein
LIAFEAVPAVWTSVATVKVVREATLPTPPAVQRLARNSTVTTPAPNICCTAVPVAGFRV